MRLLIDTQLLLWTAGQSARLSPQARSLIGDRANELLFSAASLWEIVIKAGLGRGDFRVDANQLRRGLLNNGYRELAITGEHAVAVMSLPMIHRDPFDRLLLAQSMVENITLLTSDTVMAQYPVTVQQV
jgi:PIN domain nuclease of toxin-antitoxin system